MKKVLLMAAAILAAAPACAEWTEYSSFQDDKKFYFDRSTVHVAPTGSRRVWTLSDYAIPDKAGDSSLKRFLEFDCVEKRYRVLQAMFFKGRMGGGTPSESINGPSKWSYVAPETVGETLLHIICGN